jgi:MAD (mothers against decapentaplegic) interacting protein
MSNLFIVGFRGCFFYNLPRITITIFFQDAPVAEFVWNFKTQGMSAVGQDEIVILLVKNPEEDVPPRDIFEHLQLLYELAGRGGQVYEMGYTVILSGANFLGSTDFGGFLYFRHTFQVRSFNVHLSWMILEMVFFQCLDGLDLPKEPYLFGVLTTKWEMPWARVFPLRLLLRLGAESRYYPSPLWSWRDRTTVYKEIGNTIMKLLSVSF